MMDYLLKGILIGLIFGIPIGAVGTLTVQRTWSFGIKAGLLTGLGSSVADCLYAIVGAFGLTLISDFLLRYQVVINFLGSGLILFMGIRLILKAEEVPIDNTNTKARVGLKIFLSSFLIGVTNPTVIITFLFAFSYFGISNVNGFVNGALLVCGVLIGTYIWWTALGVATCVVKRKTKRQNFCYANKVFGGIFILFGAIVFIQGFVN